MGPTLNDHESTSEGFYFSLSSALVLALPLACLLLLVACGAGFSRVR